MKIIICGSISFHEEMAELAEELYELGFDEVDRPIIFEEDSKEYKELMTNEEGAQRKIKYDLINDYYKKIVEADCILVANYTKKDVKNYIGGNSFLEIGFAYVNKKPIFLLNPIPEMIYTTEINAMKPIIINNQLDKIKEYFDLKIK